MQRVVQRTASLVKIVRNTHFDSLYANLNRGNLNFKRSVMAIAYQLLNNYTLNLDVIEGIKDNRYKDYVVSFCGYSKYYPNRS